MWRYIRILLTELQMYPRMYSCAICKLTVKGSANLIKIVPKRTSRSQFLKSKLQNIKTSPDCPDHDYLRVSQVHNNKGKHNQ